MIQKIKDFFSSVAGYIAVGVALLIGYLVYSLTSKKSEVEALKAQINLANTQKQADLIEVDIKNRLENKNLLQKEVDELNQSLVSLQDKRQQIAKEEANKTPDEVEQFWKDGK